MSQRRLPLFSPKQPISAELPTAPQPWPCALVVGDTARGDLALTWAARLCGELAQLGRPARAVVVACAAPDPSAVRAQFGMAAALLEWRPELPWPDAVTRDVEGFALGAGDATALAALRGRLNVLVGADVPLLRWPEPLRRLRGTFELELSGDGLSVVPALARSLIAGWG